MDEEGFGVAVIFIVGIVTGAVFVTAITSGLITDSIDRTLAESPYVERHVEQDTGRTYLIWSETEEKVFKGE